MIDTEEPVAADADAAEPEHVVSSRAGNHGVCQRVQLIQMPHLGYRARFEQGRFALPKTGDQPVRSLGLFRQCSEKLATITDVQHGWLFSPNDDAPPSDVIEHQTPVIKDPETSSAWVFDSSELARPRTQDGIVTPTPISDGPCRQF